MTFSASQESPFTTWVCVRDYVTACSVRPLEVGGEALLESLAIPGNEWLPAASSSH